MLKRMFISTISVQAKPGLLHRGSSAADLELQWYRGGYRTSQSRLVCGFWSRRSGGVAKLVNQFIESVILHTRRFKMGKKMLAVSRPW